MMHRPRNIKFILDYSTYVEFYSHYFMKETNGNGQMPYNKHSKHSELSLLTVSNWYIQMNKRGGS